MSQINDENICHVNLQILKQLLVPTEFKTMALLDDSLLNVYLLGSRCYGAQSDEFSDWDITLVVKSREIQVPNTNHLITINEAIIKYVEHKGRQVMLDITVTEEEEFAHTFQKGYNIEELFCLWVNSEKCKWLEKLDPRTLCKNNNSTNLALELDEATGSNQQQPQQQHQNKLPIQQPHINLLQFYNSVAKQLQRIQYVATENLLQSFRNNSSALEEDNEDDDNCEGNEANGSSEADVPIEFQQKGRKLLGIAVFYCDMVLQIATQGKVSDFTTSYKYWKTMVMQTHAKTKVRVLYKQIIKPAIDERLAQLEQICKTQQTIDIV